MWIQMYAMFDISTYYQHHILQEFHFLNYDFNNHILIEIYHDPVHSRILDPDHWGKH